MKSKGNVWIAAVIALLLSAAAFAQLPQSSPIGMRGMHLPGAGHLPGPTTLAHNTEAETPPLTLTWGIITFPGQVDSGAASVNKAGHMVGGYGPLLYENYTNHGFLLKGTKFTSIDYPGAAWTQPLAIDDANMIIGAYEDSSGNLHGFQLKGMTYTSFDYPGSTYTRPSGINKSGDIVGESDDTTDHGFLLSKGVFTPIEYPGAAYTIAWSINNAGEIAGFYGLTESDSHGFLYSGGTYTTFDYPGGYSQNYVADINDNGLIVGGYGNETTVNGVEYSWEHCYVYQSGTFTSCDVPFGPPAVTEPWHLNNYGVVTGTYVDNSATTYGYTATVGP